MKSLLVKCLSVFATMFVICDVYATETMCKNSNFTFRILHVNVDGVVKVHDDTNKRFAIVFEDNTKSPVYNIKITGITSCNEIHTTNGNESGTAVSQNTILTKLRAGKDDVGQHCWCKWEPVYVAGGDSNDTNYFDKKTGLASYWQYLKSYETDAACESNCTTACANAIAFDEKPAGQTEAKYGFRYVMFNALW